MSKIFAQLVKLVKNEYLLLSVIVLLGFSVRLYKIGNPVADWHSWRQADTASVTRVYVEEGINLLYPRYQDVSFLQSGKDNPRGYRFVEFPLYNAIHAVLVNSFPQIRLEMWGRLLTVFVSTMSIVLVYMLGKRFLGTAGGLLAGFFFAFLPFNIYFSRVILPDPMGVTFALAALLSFVWWCDTGRQWNIILSGLLFSLALLVRPYTIFYGLPMLWLASKKHNWQWREMFRNRNLWTFTAIVLLPVIAWRVWIAQYPEGIPFYTWVFNSDGIRFKPSFWRWIVGERLGGLILGGWGIFAFTAGLLTPSSKREQWFPLIFLFGMFAYVSVIATGNVRHDYYQTLVIPAVSLILAKGVLALWQTRAYLQPLTRLFLVATLGWGLFFSWYEIKEFYKINHPKIIRAGEAVARLSPEDALIVAPYNGDTAFLYHTERFGWPHLTYSIEQLIDMGATYYVSVNPKDSEAQDVYRKFIILQETDEYFVAELEPKPHTGQ